LKSEALMPPGREGRPVKVAWLGKGSVFVKERVMVSLAPRAIVGLAESPSCIPSGQLVAKVLVALEAGIRQLPCGLGSTVLVTVTVVVETAFVVLVTVASKDE
jgi:hypothetical protein